MSVRKSDDPERRKLVIMRRADTECGTAHNIGGVKRRTKERPKPSLPRMPWDDGAALKTAEDGQR
jgi:hypothetical protein